MAKIKAVYGSDVCGGEPAPSLKVDGVELVDMGITGWTFKAKVGEISECMIGFDFAGHDIEFDGIISVDGVRLPVDVSNSIMHVFIRHLTREIVGGLAEYRKSCEHLVVVVDVLDKAIKMVESTMAQFMDDVGRGETFNEEDIDG